VMARREHRDALTAVLDEVFREETTAAWLQRLRHQLPAAPVLTLPQALENPFARSIGMVHGLPHPDMPAFRALVNPIKLDGLRLPQRPGPALGADTDAILRGIGYDDAALAALRASGGT
jgi:crotonobetainyl-CoA:carnitine CoA-transferase CaiB-like acyl-CoA transferase